VIDSYIFLFHFIIARKHINHHLLAWKFSENRSSVGTYQKQVTISDWVFLSFHEADLEQRQ